MEKITYILETSTLYLSQHKYLNAIKQSFADIVPILSALSIGLLIILQLTSIEMIKNISISLCIVILFYICFITAYRYDELQFQSGLKSIMILMIVMYRCFQLIDENILDFYPRIYIFALILPLIVVKWTHLLSHCFHFVFRSIVFLPAVKEVLIQTLNCLSLFVLIFLLWFIPVSFLQLLLFVFLLLCNIVQSYLGVVIIVVLTSVFWILGMHGVGVLGTILRPFWLYMIIDNFLSYLFSQPVHYIGTESFLSWFVWIGGSGATLGAVFWMRLFAKSSHLKKIGNESLVSGIFNINETVVFGLPVVKNKHVVIPFVLVPLLCATITYILMAFHYISLPQLIIPWVFPTLIGGFLACMMNINTLIVSIALIFISFLIYSFFLRKYDIILLEQEKNINENN